MRARVQGMIRGGGRPGATLCREAGRRLCHTLDLRNAAGVSAGEEDMMKPTKPLQQARLWAMERVSKNKSHLATSLKAWRIPACVDMVVDWLPEGMGHLLYMDRLQVHQFYWKLGDPGFICTKFHMDIFDRTWEKSCKTSKVIATLEVYPHLMNMNKEKDIINLTLVSPKHWGKRCPIHYSGEQHCIGLKKGGIIKKNLTYLAFDCELELPLPDITVDVSNLDIGEEISIKDLNLNLNLMSNLELSTAVCKVLPG
eukprot:c19920_g1_i1 orf=119-883(+)